MDVPSKQSQETGLECLKITLKKEKKKREKNEKKTKNIRTDDNYFGYKLETKFLSF